MLGKAISLQFSTSSEFVYHARVGAEKAAKSDERLIYEASLQVLHLSLFLNLCGCVTQLYNFN